MTLPQVLVGLPVVERLGWGLIHSLWEGAVVAGLLSCVLYAFRARGPQARYLASCAAMGLFAAAVLATFLFSPSAVEGGPSGLQSVRELAAARPSGPDAAGNSSQALSAGEQGSTSAAGPRPIFAIRESAPAAVFHRSFTASPADGPSSRGARTVRQMRDRLAAVFPWLVVAWLAGVMAAGAWHVGGWIAARRLRSVGAFPATAALRATTRRLGSVLGLSDPPDILLSLRASSPLVLGAFKPLILMPASLLTGLAPIQIEAIIAHELAHIARKDYLINLMQTAIEVLLFYHPATWWIGRQVRAERENCCDDIAVAFVKDRTTYVRALAALAECHAPRIAAAAAAAPLLNRIRRLTGLPEASRARAPVAAAGALGLAAALLGVMLVSVAGTRTAVQAGERPSTNSNAPVASVDAADASANLGWLCGTITDPAGQPVPGAAITLDPDGDQASAAAPPVHAESDQAGKFRLGPLPAGYRSGKRIRIEAPGFAQAFIAGGSYTVFAGAQSDVGAVQLERGRTFGGTVLDVDGSAVGGQLVEYSVLRLVSGYGIDQVLPARKLVTDASGHFQTPPLPVGLLSIDVRVPERQLSGWGFEAITPGGHEELPIHRLVRDFPILGIVTDVQGHPVSGASIDANGFPTTSAANGTFVLRGCSPKTRYQVQFRKSGYAMAQRLVETLEHDFRYGGPIHEDGLTDDQIYPIGPATELKVEMQPVEWINCRAVDADTSASVQVSRAVLCSFERKAGGEIVLSTCRLPEFEQPEKGRFRVGYYAPQEYHLTVSADGYDDAEAFTPSVRTMQPISGIVVKMKKQRGPVPLAVSMQSLTGIVTRHGKPVKTGWIGLWKRSRSVNVCSAYLMRGRTAEGPPVICARAPIHDGAYTLDVPYQDKDWYVVAEEPGQPLTEIGPLPVALNERKQFDIECIEGGGIVGRVDRVPSGWTGEVWVVAFNRSGVRAECRADVDGHFQFRQLPPGEYGLKAGNDALRDKEVPHPPVPESVWRRPADPWRQATVVNVRVGSDAGEIALTLPEP